MIDVSSPAVVKELLNRNKLACRKSLGQNFLVDANISNKIVAAANLSGADLVVEIGSGLGALTLPMARVAGQVLAVEIDRGLVGLLSQITAATGKVTIVAGDALKTDLDALVTEQSGGLYGLGGKPYKLVANLPYYIASPLLMHLLGQRFNLSELVVMVQYEVAVRLAAEAGSKAYGVLSVAAQYYSRVELLFRLPGTVFYPTTAVDSAVVRLTPRRLPEAAEAEETFFKVVRAAFAKRRKTLLNTLASGLGVEKQRLAPVLKEVGLDPTRRGETLTLADFTALTAQILKSFK